MRAPCKCGCGRIARGEYVRGHRPVVRWVLEDRGYLSPCWIWQLQIDRDGYGRVWNPGGSRLAHRARFEAAGGVVPEGHELDHLCRVRSCINPEHMEPVRHAQNVHRGHRAKLTWEAVDAIRAAAASGISHTVIAVQHSISTANVTMIVRGTTWREETR